MSWLEACLLGLVQGLTEFLPVSSDGHLSAAEMLLPGFAQVGVLFDVMVHLGTLVAVVVYFRKTLAQDAAGLFSRKPAERSGSWKLAVLVVAATIPTGILGLLLRQVNEESKTDPRFVGSVDILTGRSLVRPVLGRARG